ncbi:hypothetical protein F4604DRAFT_1690068 [Suillus subluteus]|nr:hypothetical protein F4604DRAFT_1690068 [Suillus subluteus]
MAFFFRMVDNGIKLSSLLSIPNVSDVHTMNKITSDELNCLVTHEDPPEASQPLGHLLSHIFQPFKIPLPDDLPVNPPGDESDSNTGSASSTPVSPDPEAAGSATYEEIVASFMNALAGCLSASQPLLERECYATRTWSAASAHKALPGSDIKCKPDLVLSDDITARWGNIRISSELTHSPYKPAMRLGKAADTHAYLMMSEQPWRRFALILSFTDAYHHLRVLMYNHSGGAVSTRFDIYQQPDIFSHIVTAINFGSLECVGYNSTVSFMKHVSPPLSTDIHVYRPIKNIPVRRSSSADPAASTSESLVELLVSESPSSDDHLESVVSDSEERSSEDSLEGSSNDTTTQSFAPEESPPLSLSHTTYYGDNIYIIKRILFMSQGLVGCGTICYLASLNEEDYIVKDHWVLGKQDDVLNEIEMLKLMHGVPGIPELVDYWLITTSEVQKTAVEERKILHRDCSLNNAMILDNLDISKGFLIDWEFAVRITADNKYTIGGTFSGPNGTVHQERMTNSLLNRWTNLDLALCAAFKITFFANPLDEERLLDEFHPYFKPLVPLAKDWCAALKDNMVHPITFDTILHVLNSHLDQLPDDEELQSTMAMLMKSATVLNNMPNLKHAASISLQPVGPGMPKRKKSDEQAAVDTWMAGGSNLGESYLAGI